MSTYVHACMRIHTRVRWLVGSFNGALAGECVHECRREMVG